MNSNDKFYFLGLVFADGYLSERKRHSNEYIGITLIDKQILSDISTRFNFKEPKQYGTTKAGNPIYTLKTYDKELISEYKSYGLIPRKSLILKLLRDIDEKYMWDFIRGYFDGDGCIHYHKVKERINSYVGELSLLGTEDILTHIQKFLIRNDIKSTIKPYNKIFKLKIYQFEDLKNVYNKIYNDDTSLRLQRKYIHFSDYIVIKTQSLIKQFEHIKKEQAPRLSDEEFRIYMENIYQNEGYDFSSSKYTKTRDNTEFECPLHGIVSQKITYLLRGRGCPKCSKKFVDNDTFINSARKIHGNKYDYSNVEYVNNKTKVCIICPEHGEFWQTPSNHLLGRGCPICGKIKNYSARARENNKKRKEFITSKVKLMEKPTDDEILHDLYTGARKLSELTNSILLGSQMHDHSYHAGEETWSFPDGVREKIEEDKKYDVYYETHTPSDPYDTSSHHYVYYIEEI